MPTSPQQQQPAKARAGSASTPTKTGSPRTATTSRGRTTSTASNLSAATSESSETLDKESAYSRQTTADTTTADPAPPKQLTPEEEAKVAELKSTQEELRGQLAEIEGGIKAVNTLQRAENIKEKSLQLDEKTSELKAKSKEMKKEVQVFRNSDRVMVSLRDTHSNMQKHLQIKSAHIRQKEATIELLDRRCGEQLESVKELLVIFEGELKGLSEVTREMEQTSSLANRIEPLQCASAMIHFDANEEQTLVHLEERARHLHREDENITAEIHNSKGGNTEETNARLRTKDLERGAVEQQWTNERRFLQRKYLEARRMQEELAFHVKRGTNIKSFETLNCCAPSTAMEEVRKLTQIHEESLLELEQLKKQKLELQKKTTPEEAKRRTKDIEAINGVLHQLLTQHALLEENNGVLRKHFEKLQRQYIAATEGDPIAEEECLDHLHLAITGHERPRAADSSTGGTILPQQPSQQAAAGSGIAAGTTTMFSPAPTRPSAGGVNGRGGPSTEPSSTKSPWRAAKTAQVLRSNPLSLLCSRPHSAAAAGGESSSRTSTSASTTRCRTPPTGTRPKPKFTDLYARLSKPTKAYAVHDATGREYIEERRKLREEMSAKRPQVLTPQQRSQYLASQASSPGRGSHHPSSEL